ncbi:hypothetical protein [Kribbella ginsengisoli]|uniref:Uncharacterized protein n=1 Tax=Kribbella ginsengisoli TaxID=363865 RepID=A0ABP6YSK2_9ACTN
MRTEDSLREALEFFEAQAAQLEPEPPRTPVRRVRRAVVLAAVAATAAAAVLVPAALHRDAPHPPVTETPKPPVTWTHQQTNVEPASGITRVYFGSDRSTCWVSERPGNYDPVAIGALRKKTMIDGHPADLIQVTTTTGSGQKPHLMMVLSYRPGRWTRLDCSQPPDDLDQAERQILSFADSVDTGPQQLRAPIDFVELPPGTRVRSISAGVGYIQLEIARNPNDMITATLNWPPQARVFPGDQPVQVNGRTGWVRASGVLRIPFGTYDLEVHASIPRADQTAIALAIAKEIRTADPNDRSSWFPAEVGLSPR